MHLMIYFELNDLEFGKHYNWTQKCWNLARYHHLTHITSVQKLRGLRKKLGYTLCTNWTISFKVQGFQTKTHLLQRHFIFLNLFQLKNFFASNMQHSKPHTEISTLSDYIWYVALNVACWMQKNSWVEISLEKWNVFVIDEFSSKTLVLWKRWSSLYTKYIQFLS